ncbi:uncharacterized protein [Paramisgurnus dabryanus]|uniref:uncharacterized protein n=1 Tax=Paramisgurnus dabryanus TaxID=90735 RepID=UPI0031F34AC3
MEDIPKTLVAVLLDEKEICKKLQRFKSVAEIMNACKSLLPCAAEYHRILKFNVDFNEFIDTDLNEKVENLDKFQVFFKSVKRSGSQALDETLDVDVAGPSHQQNVAPKNVHEAGPSSQQKHQRNRIDVDTLRALIESKGPSILTDYEASGMLSETSRKLLVKIGVSALVERSGFYPCNDEKRMLAESVVTLFPSLKIKIGEENEGFEHFYDPVSHSGFIEMKLRNLRRNLHDDQRLYQRKRIRISDSSVVSITLEVEDESTQEWTTVIKRMKPSPENLHTIKMGMEKTYSNRRSWISNKSPTVKEIFEEYPRFIDMPYLLDTEFGKMFPGKADLFLRKWEGNIVPKLQKMATEKDPLVMPTDNGSEESCYRALQLLTTLLPPTASGRSKGWAKCSTKSALVYLLDIKPAGTSISSLLDNSQKIVENHQPHIVCFGAPSSTAQYIIVAENDKLAIPLEDNSLTCAIDKLFKVYWVCNVEYPAQLTSVFNFFESLYELPFSGGKRSKVVELIAKLQALS